MFREELLNVNTLGKLRESGYKSRHIKSELRENLICKMQKQDTLFKGILGYENSVIPDIQRALLSRHNIILLGLRGQAKTRIARQMVELLDEYIPIIKGSEINDDPYSPLSRFGKDQVAEYGNDTPIEWLHRSERYTEKLATPDVTIADLLGDVDPIKAATLKLPYADERVIHFGLIPRSHRSIFVINELPDLQARIQVALFNILQESDVQIRGFKLRLPLDIQFVFTANPEDYTNRGSIVTPLKDRLGSQILTHYPKDLEISKKITQQEVHSEKSQNRVIDIPELAQNLIEQIAFEARSSEYIDAKSGVSARLPISAFENLKSAAERRLLLNQEDQTMVRISDFSGVVPAITGKIELVYEGEQEGPFRVAQYLIGKAIKSQFTNYFPDPEQFKRKPDESPYQKISDWFRKGNTLDILDDTPQKEYENTLNNIQPLRKLIERYQPGADDDMKLLLMEFALHGLAEFSVLSKHIIDSGMQFQDLLSGMFSTSEEEDDEDLDDFSSTGNYL